MKLSSERTESLHKNLLRAARNTGLLILVLTLLWPTVLVAGQSSATKKKKAKRSRQTQAARKRPAPPLIYAPNPAVLNASTPSTNQNSVSAGEQKGVRTKPQAKPVQKPDADATAVTSISIQPVSASVINFEQLALMEKAKPKVSGPVVGEAIHPPGAIDDSTGETLTPQRNETLTLPKTQPQTGDDPGGPLVPSPAPSANYLGQEDGPKIGTANFVIPPDTNGAVGIDKVFSNTNQNYRVQDKTTGAALSTVSSDTFWASSGGSGFFDPQIAYDPYNQRWILALASNSSSATSSIEIAVSQTSDPSGSYNVFRFVVGCAGGSAGCNVQGEWADFPMIGFNKNWIAVGMNMFQIVGTGAGGAQQNNNDKTLVIDYAAARANVATATLFSGLAIGFCNYPVSTYSATENTLYLAQHLSSGGATYKISTITGTPAAPTFTIGPTLTRPGGGWTQPGGDLVPQQCIPGVSIPTQVCPGTPRRIDVGDAQVRSNPIFRNGRVWYAQTIALPTGGLTTGSRIVAQWTSLDAVTAAFVDGGRVEDPTATLINGGKNYAYPSLAVNKNNDVLMGFSEGESDDYIDAGYTFRLGTDATGTMRDPLIYKEGEDYYEKTFSLTRNRWGDYSHTLIDPVNDRDMWTVQEYAQARVGATGTGSNDSRWGTWWAKVSAPAGAGDLMISEFRLRGPNGALDEFIEIYNTNDSPLTVATVDGSAGYAVAASDGVIRCTIPTGTTIPARGHYLCVNSVGYGLGSYPAGNATTATGDATYTTDIPDNSGIALFNTATVANFSTATRLDAAGFTTEPNTLYREGAGIPSINPTFNIEHAFYRDNCGKGGSITTGGKCPSGGLPVDTNNNAADFVFVDTNGTSAGAGQRLGAPGPENLSSPIQRNSSFGVINLDPGSGGASAPNRVRDFTSDPANNSTFGTLLIRRTVTNNTALPVTRLRFRIIDYTTFPAPSGFADLRARTSSLEVVSITGPNPACPANLCTVQATTLETPPTQLNGGGFNSTLSAGTVTLGTPIPPGGSINLQFLLGIQQVGTFRFFINIEALP